MKNFADFDEQIRILKEDKKLTINGMDNTVFALRNCGYYEIVNGYKIFLLDPNAETETFREDETFEHLASLYNSEEYPEDWEILAMEMGYPKERLKTELELLKSLINFLK